jgi:hypothetical protein
MEVMAAMQSKMQENYRPYKNQLTMDQQMVTGAQLRRNYEETTYQDCRRLFSRERNCLELTDDCKRVLRAMPKSKSCPAFLRDWIVLVETCSTTKSAN